MRALTSRKVAIASGSLTYDGKPCRFGHGTQRYVSGYNCVECIIIRSRQSTADGYHQRYRIKNAQKCDEQSRKWRAKNPEKRRAIANNYKHRRRAQEEGGISSAELGAWTKAQKKICYWCGIKCAADYHVDHYEPLSKGGKHEEGNLVVACKRCNLRKNAKDPIQFANQCGILF